MPVLLDWSVSPAICPALFVAGALYAAGLLRRQAVRRWRAVSFAGGLVLLYLTLQSPLDALAAHFFVAHQVQHQLLLGIVPALLVSARPQSVLIAALPARLKQRALAPLLRCRAARALFRGLAHPAAASLLFVGICWFWNLPPINDASARDPGIDEVAHVTMLAAGLVYWWRIVDDRPPPMGASYLVRLFMLKVAMMAMALFGGYLVLKEVALYGGYDRFGFALAPLADEAMGGVVLWFGGAIVPLAAAFVIARRWRQDPDWELRRRGAVAGAGALGEALANPLRQ